MLYEGPAPHYLVADHWEGDFDTSYGSYDYLAASREYSIDVPKLFEARASVNEWISYPHIQRGSQIRSAPGYGGPIVSKNISTTVLNKLWSFWEFERRVGGITSEFIVFSPWLENHLTPPPGVKVSQKGQVFVVESGEFKPAHRTRWTIRSASKKVYTLRQRPGGMEYIAYVGKFAELHKNAMEKYGVEGVSPKNLEAMKPHIYLAFSKESDQLLGGAAILVDTVGNFHYHLAASTEEGHKKGAPSLILADAIDAIYDAPYPNAKMYLGGGRKGQDDSLAFFKMGFASYAVPLYIGEWQDGAR